MTLLQSFNIAKSGLDTASTRLTNHSTNIANAATPYYKRKIPVVSESNMVSFQGVLEDMRNNLFRTGLTFQSNGASYEGFVEDPTPGQKVYQPGHPQADENGYITLSNVNVVNDMADAIMASKLYEANLSVVSITRQMANKALEIGRGGQ
ncbi:MAG: flagellar basal body rod protein FlgC [Cyanobacteria bacterium HKST-UBA06]|nr:flagellar basal body rod protein FlgC [Cyanobacteria bacterium HKST-UBA05]MCA9799615.1 flagellar basal body rod protein FlgC [Cyanobacteria bacterium HKST-UBA04]MCA9806793.1 flagellar basal body rod protein FlgC [Cyanobacteria bacterium HKST-UBA06]MCA9841424.1 flagellar basal body rod protein FlgC [Cyanobacteria bacterium HKST-UBA03]